MHGLLLYQYYLIVDPFNHSILVQFIKLGYVSSNCPDAYYYTKIFFSLFLVGLVRAIVLVRLINHVVETKSLLGGFSAGGDVVCM